MQKPIILVGGGGHCLSVIEAAESEGKKILGILEIPSEFGKEVLPGHKVIGCDDDMLKYVEEADFINTIGFISTPSLRLKISEKDKQSQEHSHLLLPLLLMFQNMQLLEKVL